MFPKYVWPLAALLALAFTAPAAAKPIAFGDGYTVMYEYGAGTMQEAQAFYAPRYWYSAGVGYLRLAADDGSFSRDISYARVNGLLRRWTDRSRLHAARSPAHGRAARCHPQAHTQAMSGSELQNLRSNTVAAAAALFASSGTLICCALPALLVALGAGAALAGLVTAVPQLVWLSAHKVLVFGLSGTMLALAGALQWRALPCPADPKLAAACNRTRRISAVVYVWALAIFVTGALFAFVLPRLV